MDKIRNELFKVLARDWGQVEQADGNGDGKIDIVDYKGNLTDSADPSSYATNQIKDAAEASLISGKNDWIFDPHGAFN